MAFVGRLWRYPVKSMLGEDVRALPLHPAGVVGDRAYGFLDAQTGKLVSAKRAKRFGALLHCRARFLSEPTEDCPAAPIEVTFPDGNSSRDDDAELTRRASELVGRQVRLVATAPDGLGHAAPGAMLDLAGLHILAASTLHTLASEHPSGEWDPQRMRPNILVAGDAPVDEAQWLGCDLHIGTEAVARIAGPTPRCVMTTLAQPGLGRDPGILRAIAAVGAKPAGVVGEFACAGLYADVVRPGTVRIGDSVHFEYH